MYSVYKFNHVRTHTNILSMSEEGHYPLQMESSPAISILESRQHRQGCTQITLRKETSQSSDRMLMKAINIVEYNELDR